MPKGKGTYGSNVGRPSKKRKYMTGGKSSKYENGGNVPYNENPRRGTFSDPGRRTDTEKLKTYRNYTPEQKIEQYKFWDKSQPGGRQYSSEGQFPLDENHPDYGTENWKYLTDPKWKKSQEKRGITFKYDNKGRLVRLNRRGKVVGGTKAQRNERNITPKGPQQETLTHPKKEVTKLPTKPTPGITIPNKTIQQPEIKQETTPKPEVEKKGGETFDEAFKAARARGARDFDWSGEKTGGETRKFHTRQANETEEQWNEKFPKEGTEKTKTAAEATKEGSKTVEAREEGGKDAEPQADREEVKLTPKMEEDRDMAKKETKSPMDTSDDELEKTFVKAMDDEPKKPTPAPKQKPEPEPEPKEEKEAPEPKEDKEPKESSSDDSKDARRGAVVRANKKGRKRRRYENGGTTDKKDKPKPRTASLREKERKELPTFGKENRRDKMQAAAGRRSRPMGAKEKMAKAASVPSSKKPKEKDSMIGGMSEGEWSKLHSEKRSQGLGYQGGAKNPNNPDEYGILFDDGAFHKEGSYSKTKMEEGGNVKVKLHKDEDKKTIGDTNLTLSGDFGVDAAKKNVEKKNTEKKDDTSSDTTKKVDTESTKKPEKEEGRGNYHDGSDTPQVIRDKEIDRNRGWDDGDGDIDGDGETTENSGSTKRTRPTKDERFDRRQSRKDERNERRLDRRKQRENRKKYRKESRQYRRTERRKQRQEKRANKGMKYTGGRRISPRRWYKNLKDKLGGTVWEGKGRLKDHDEFKTSRTVKPIREYKRGGVADAYAESYENGGTAPKKESRLRSRWNRFMQKRDEKPIGQHQFDTKGPESMYSKRRKIEGAMNNRGLEGEIVLDTNRVNKLKSMKNLTTAQKKELKQAESRLRMRNKIKEQQKFPKENRMDTRDIYLKEKESQAKASQEAWDSKKEGWKKEDKAAAEKRAEGSEKHKQRTSMPTMSSMKEKGGMVRKYRYGGIRTINKEGKKHGASEEQMDYAKGLYKGANKNQKKDAMKKYREYKRTGEIPEGSAELYEEVGGDRYLKNGGRVRKHVNGGIKAINKEGKKHGASSDEMSYMKNLYKNASPKQKKEAMKMYREYQRTGKIPEGAKELYNEAGGDRMMQEGGKVDKSKKVVKKKLPRDNKGNVVYGPAGDADPDQLTFGEAFADARRAGTTKFKWRGKWYTTKTK